MQHTSDERSSLDHYYNFLVENRNYRLYLLSHCMQHIGDWLIRVAGLLTVVRLAPGSSTAISICVLVKIIPEIIVTPLGGILCDKYDRKNLMIVLDTIGALATLGFILALRSGDVFYLYMVIFLRSSISALYEPTSRAIFPMFVTDPEDLKRGATLNTTAWSTMLLLGGVVGGYASARVGIEVCYALDCISYFISALIMSRVDGFFLVTYEQIQDGRGEDEKQKIRPKLMSMLTCTWDSVQNAVLMAKEFVVYLLTSSFALCALMKACGALTWGPQDILNPAFCLVEGDEVRTSERVGLIYTCAGIGSIIGPFLANKTTKAEQPDTLQKACIGSFIFLIIGWLGIAISHNFASICFFTMIRSIGNSIVWMNATLLLQTLTSPVMLGRMLSLESSVTRCAEALAAFLTGRLLDAGHDRQQIAFLSAWVGTMMITYWSIYHYCGGGAANKQHKQISIGSYDDEQALKEKLSV